MATTAGGNSLSFSDIKKAIILAAQGCFIFKQLRYVVSLLLLKSHDNFCILNQWCVGERTFPLFFRRSSNVSVKISWFCQRQSSSLPHKERSEFRFDPVASETTVDRLKCASKLFPDRWKYFRKNQISQTTATTQLMIFIFGIMPSINIIFTFVSHPLFIYKNIKTKILILHFFTSIIRRVVRFFFLDWNSLGRLSKSMTVCCRRSS